MQSFRFKNKNIRHYALVALLILAAIAPSGCGGSGWVKVRRTPKNPLAGPLGLLTRHGPKPTTETQQFLRRHDMSDQYRIKPVAMLANIESIVAQDPTADSIYRQAELAYIAAKRYEKGFQRDKSLSMYGQAVTSAYLYLFDPRFDAYRNPYSPQFRRACEIYNEALEGSMRLISRHTPLKPGGTYTLETPQGPVQIRLKMMGPWRDDEFERFEFASDYDVNGLNNHYRTYGLGVPLIAVRKTNTKTNAIDRFYPPGLAVGLTAFLRVTHEQQTDADGKQAQVCLLELYDPTVGTDIRVDRRLVPLETDLSTPLAYFLNQPMFRGSLLATQGLIYPERARAIKGLYMLEPYQANKIPVILTHGLWSSPVTWTQMFNDLRGRPELHQRYQFWFYMYPTGEPFWISAGRMRKDLQEAYQLLDPSGQQRMLHQTVIIGHSMGGLIAKLQTLDSGDDFWDLVSNRRPEELNMSAEELKQLRASMFFEANRSIRRVITIASPHRGSNMANSTARWLGKNVIQLPERLARRGYRLRMENPGQILPTSPTHIGTSIDSLATDSSFFPVMLEAERSPQVRYHNIVGEMPSNWLFAKLSVRGDGVVPYESAHLDDVASEISVAADHTGAHQHSRAVLEVRRVLLEHLKEIGAAHGHIADTPPQKEPPRLPAQWPSYRHRGAAACSGQYSPKPDNISVSYPEPSVP